MGKIIRGLLIIGTILLVSILPAHAYWKHKVAVNERMAEEYIEKLQAGADPKEVERPTMRFISHYQAMQEQDRLINAMDEAEALAKEGKHELIPEIELKFQNLEKDPVVQE